jgi:hypothetical protein
LEWGVTRCPACKQEIQFPEQPAYPNRPKPHPYPAIPVADVVDQSTPLGSLRPLLGVEPSGKSTATIDTFLDDEDKLILRALAKNAALLLSYQRIRHYSGCRVSTGTISKRMPRLLKEGLVWQPYGPKGGTSITPKGKELVERVNKSES